MSEKQRGGGEISWTKTEDFIFYEWNSCSSLAEDIWGGVGGVRPARWAGLQKLWNPRTKEKD